jgi:hypothetical protein
VDGGVAAAVDEAIVFAIPPAITPTPFVLRYRSTDGSQRRKVEQFALRYLRANGKVEILRVVAF